jgi:hypothetical protein
MERTERPFQSPKPVMSIKTPKMTTPKNIIPPSTWTPSKNSLPSYRRSCHSCRNTCRRQSRAPRTTRLQPDRNRQPGTRQTKHHIIMMSISIVLQPSWEMQEKSLSTTRYLVKHHPSGNPTLSNMTKFSWRGTGTISTRTRTLCTRCCQSH